MDEATRRAIAGRSTTPFIFDLQQFAEDDDLPDVPALELTEDIPQLKALARNLHRDLVKTRSEAGKRRIQLRQVEGERDQIRTEFATFKTTAETEKTKLAGELETANRSNGQLKSRFKDQFVNKAVLDALKAAGAADDAAPVIIKALDLSKVEFNEETLEPKGHDVLVEEFKKASPSFFQAKNNGARGTTANKNGASNNAAGTGGGDSTKFDFNDEAHKGKTFEQIARESLLATIATS